MLFVIDIVIALWCSFVNITSDGVSIIVVKVLLVLVLMMLSLVITFTGYKATSIEPTDMNVLEEL